MNRADEVRRYFFTNVNFEPDFQLREIPLSEWDRTADSLHAPFGYLPATVVDEPSAHWLVDYCPELIAAQTEDLADSDLEDYLSMLELHLNMHISHYADPDEDDLEKRIDSTMYELAPIAMNLVGRVQIEALDN